MTLVDEPTPAEGVPDRTATEAGTPVVAPDVEPVRPKRPGLGGIIRDSASSWREVRRTPYGTKPVVYLTAITFFSTFQGQVFRSAGPEIRRDLDLSLDQLISLIVTLGVVTAVGNLGIGYVAERWNRAKMMGVGVMLDGILGIATAGATGKASFSTTVAGANVAGEMTAVPRGSVLVDYYPVDMRGRVFSLLGSFPRIVTVLVPVVIGVMVTQLSWRAPYVVFSIPLIVLGIVILLRLPEPVRGYFERKAQGVSEDDARKPEEPVSFGEAWRTLWSVKTIRRNYIADVFGYGGDVVFGLYFTYYLDERFGLNAAERGYLFSIVGVGALVGVFLGGGLVDQLLRRRPSQILLYRGLVDLLGVLFLIPVIAIPRLPVIVVLFTVRSFLSGLTAPASSVISTNLYPSHVRSTGLVLSGLVALPGTLIIFPLGSSLVEDNGFRGAMWFSVPFFIVSALIALTASPLVEGDLRNSLRTAIAGMRWREAKASGRGKLLVCREVDVAYDGVQVLFGVDFEVDEGEVIALLGTNGAGKSTLLKAISGIQEAENGSIVFDGRDITHMPPHEIARRGVVHMPGGRGVFPGLSVRDNLQLGTWMASDERDAADRLREALEIFPRLRERLDAEARLLSGGEQQQLSLAQAFMSRPKMLCIDELSLGLSPAVVGELLDIVREINRRGVTVVVVEQSVNVALTIATRCVFMEKGEVRFSGPTAELLRRPDVLRAVYVKGTGTLTAGPASAKRSEGQQRALELGTAKSVLEVQGLVKRFGGITAVDDVSFALRDGEALGFIGPNGSGKTTTLELISGYQKADAGTVLLEGIDVTAEGPEQRARRGLVRRFQDARLFPALTVEECLLVALEQQVEVKSPFLLAAGLPQARRAERRLRVRSERLIDLLELGAYREKRVRELSTGLRRIVDIACVLAAEPKVLLLDEPSSGIAQAETEGLGPLFNRIRFETGCSLLIIEHDMPLISAVADELIAMDRGSVVLRGAPDVVLNDERVVESYLGGSEAAVKRSGALP